MSSADAESGGIAIRTLLTSKSLTPEVRARIAAADVDGDGSLSVEELVMVMQSEVALASERRVLRRVAVVLAVGLVLAIAAVAGLTYGVVAASKDTASSGGALVDKASGAPLATGAARGVQELSGLWLADADTSLAGLTEFITTGADGVQRMWRVAGVEVAAGKWARVNTTEPGVSLYIDAAGALLEGVPAEQAAGNANLQALCVPGIGDACIAGRLKKELFETVNNCPSSGCEAGYNCCLSGCYPPTTTCVSHDELPCPTCCNPNFDCNH